MTTLNKVEMARVIECSLPTLDRLILRHGADFPVVKRGSNGIAWEFDPAAVTGFLRDVEARRVAAHAAKDDLMQQYTLPGVEAQAEAGLKPGELLALARVRQIQREEAQEAGFLVRKAEVRAAVTAGLASLRRWQDNAIRQVLDDHNIPDAVVRSVVARVQEGQRKFVSDVQEYLVEGAPYADSADPAFL